jgi:type I restriction enzyme S subunit
MEVRPGYKQTEVGLIPNDWRSSRMGDEADLLTGFPFKSSEFKKSGVRLLRGSNVKRGVVDWSPDITQHWPRVDAETRVFELKVDDLVIAMDGALVGRSFATITTADLPALLVQRVARLRSRKAAQGLLRAWVASDFFVRHVDLVKTHTAIPHISPKDIRAFALAVPDNADEQRAIAAALSDVDALLGGLDRLIAKKRALKQAAMQQLLTGQTRLPGFLGEWGVRWLPSLAIIPQGQVDPRDVPYCSMYLIGPEHVESGTGKLLTRRTAREQGAISGKYLFKKGDVVYGKINPYLRKAFLAEFDGLCSADMYPLRPGDGVAPGFLLAVILGREFAAYSESVSVRSGMPKINREEMAGFSTRVPKDIHEQSAIAAVLYDMDAELAALEARRVKTRDLKHAMMQELLTGKTRLVPAGAAHA